jgi:hypothetical protein
MSVIRLGYTLNREKGIYKNLSNLNRSLKIENAYLKSPRYLNKLSNADLGLTSGLPAALRKVSILPAPETKGKLTNKRLARFLRLNAEAQARPAKK